LGGKWIASVHGHDSAALARLWLRETGDEYEFLRGVAHGLGAELPEADPGARHTPAFARGYLFGRSVVEKSVFSLGKVI
jgi:hypothetical protein